MRWSDWYAGGAPDRHLAGVLAVLGLSTLPGLVLVDYFSVVVEHVAGLEAAVNAEGAVEKRSVSRP